jgi:hypothetical protein
MKIAQFNVLLVQAQQAVDQHAAGIPVSESLLGWSRALLASNPTSKRFKPRPRQDQIMAMFISDPKRYVTRNQIMENDPSMPEWAADITLKKMMAKGVLHALRVGFRKRYFMSKEARDAGAAEIEAGREAAAAEKKERRRLADQARQARRTKKAEAARKPKAAPKQITYSKKPGRDMPKARGEAIIPPGLVIQVCPGYVDRRFLVEGPIVGGFLSEFKTLRSSKGAS